MTYPDGLPLAGDLVASGFEQWPATVRQECEDNEYTPVVGGRLLMEDERIRVWDRRLAPGEHMAAHRHVRDYLWTTLVDGTGLQHTHDGTTGSVRYTAGETRAYTFGPGEFPPTTVSPPPGSWMPEFRPPQQVRGNDPRLPPDGRSPRQDRRPSRRDRA